MIFKKSLNNFGGEGRKIIVYKNKVYCLSFFRLKGLAVSYLKLIYFFGIRFCRFRQLYLLFEKINTQDFFSAIIIQTCLHILTLIWQTSKRSKLGKDIVNIILLTSWIFFSLREVYIRENNLNQAENGEILNLWNSKFLQVMKVCTRQIQYLS